MTSRVYKSIEEIVNKRSTNKDGIIFDVVMVEDREFVKDFLTRFYIAFKTFFKNEYDAEEIFCSRLEFLMAFRMDYSNSKVFPINILWEHLNGNNSKNNDRTITASTGFIQNEGVVMIVPEFMKSTKDEAELAFIHELCHLFSSYIKFDGEGNFSFVTGLRIDKTNKKLVEADEGLTEYVAHLIWSKMYPDIKCPGQNSYANFVKRTKKMLKSFDDENQIIEDYFIDGQRVIKAIEQKIKEKEEKLALLTK